MIDFDIFCPLIILIPWSFSPCAGRLNFCLDGWQSYRGNCFHLVNHPDTWTNAEVRQQTWSHECLLQILMRRKKLLTLLFWRKTWHSTLSSSSSSSFRVTVQSLRAAWLLSTVFGSIGSFSAWPRLEVTLSPGWAVTSSRFDQNSIRLLKFCPERLREHWQQ